MRKLAHQTLGAQKMAGVAPEDTADYRVGDRVMTTDGFPGTVASVETGPYGKYEAYNVVLDNGMGGGEYRTGQIYREPVMTASAQSDVAPEPFEATATTAHQSASFWYPELGTLLEDRLPPENLKVYASKSHYDRANEAFDAGHDHGYAHAGHGELADPEGFAATWYDQEHAPDAGQGYTHGYSTWHNEAETELPHKGGSVHLAQDGGAVDAGGADGPGDGTGEDGDTGADPVDDQDATGGQSNVYWPPDVCSWCGFTGFGQPIDTGRGHRVKCAQCGGTMNKTYDGVQWQPDFPNSPGNTPSRRGDPRARINDPRSVHSLRLYEPVGAPLNVAASMEAGYLIYDVALSATAGLHLDLGEHAREFGFEFTSAWRDVVAKARRIRKEGGVRVLAASGEGVVGEVDGDHAIYETEFRYIPGTKKVAYWHCGCKWAAYAWGRSPAYRRFEGRACSHNLALRFETNSRGMFGRDVTLDSDRLPGQYQRTPVQVEHQRGTDRAPELEINRRSVPPGNMRTEWAPNSRVRVKGSWIGDNPDEPTLHWRAPNLRYEVHIKNHMPDRDLRENYGAQPHQYVSLHENDIHNPYSKPSIRNVDDHGLAAVDQFGNRPNKPPAHVMKHVQDAVGHVAENAATHADLYGQIAEQHDIRSDLANVPHQMEQEQRGKAMFENLLRSADERDQHEGSLTPAHEWSSVALASGVSPAEVLAVLRGLGMAHESARGVLTWASTGPFATLAYADGAAHEVAYVDGDTLVTTAGAEISAEALRYQAMPWHDQGGKGGMSAEKAKARSVRDAGFKGYVGPSEDSPYYDDEHEGHGGFDEDLWDHTTPEPTAQEHAHFLQHDDYPDSHHERHEQAYQHAVDKREAEDEPDHEDDHLGHFVIEHGSDSDLWRKHSPQPQDVDISKGVYATQSHVGQFHIDRHLKGNDTSWHLQQHPDADNDYLGDHHPMFVTHEGRLHATEGHHRIAAAIQRGDTHVSGWHYDLDKHPVAPADEWDTSTDGRCSTCKEYAGEHEDEHQEHAASLHTADAQVGGFGASPNQDFRPKTRHSESANPASTGWATSSDPTDWTMPIGYSSLTHWNSSLHTAQRETSEDDTPTHAGVALKAGDTGRVLMIQRSNKDENDPAKGTWEFPGGGLEDGDKTSLHGAVREFEEEVGHPFPEGAHMTHVHRNKNYVLHTLVTPHESDVDFTNGRATVNPDDPDGDDHEQSAWWEPDHAAKNPALRREVKKTPWDAIKKAAVLDVSPVTFSENVRDDVDPPTYKSSSLTDTTAILHDEPEPALPFTEGGDEDAPDLDEQIDQEGERDGAAPTDEGPGLPTTRNAPWGFPEDPQDIPQPVDDAPALEEDADQNQPFSTDVGGSGGYQVESSRGEPVNPILAEFWKTAGGAALMKDAKEAGPEVAETGGKSARAGEENISDGDIAAAARAVLSKLGAKDFSFAEQQELIEEGLSTKARARNFDELQIDGTHYANLGDDDDLFAALF